MEIQQVRIRVLQDWVAEIGNQEAAAPILGVSPGYVSQLMNGYRPITEKTARKFEERLKKPIGSMDMLMEGVKEERAAYSKDDIELMDKISQLSPADKARLSGIIDALGIKPNKETG